MFKTFKAAVRNPKTTIAGILVFVSLAAKQISFLFDESDTTNPDWNLICAGIAALVGLFIARDADKSTEDQK